MKHLHLLARPALGIAIGAAFAAGFASIDPALAATVALGNSDSAVAIMAAAVVIWFVARRFRLR